MKKIIPFKKDIIFKTNLAEITSISLEHTLHKEDEQLVTGEFIISGNYKISDNSINVDGFSYNLPFDINIDEKYETSKIEIDIDDFYYEIVNNNILSVNIDIIIDKLEDKPLIEIHEDKKIENEEEKEVSKEVLKDEEQSGEEIRSIENETNDLFDEFLSTSIEENSNEQERCIENENIENEEFENNYDEEDLRKKNKNIEMKITKKEKKVEKKELKEEKIMKEQIMSNSANQIKSIFTTFDSDSETYATYKVYLVREGDNLESIMQKYEIDREALSYYNDLNDLKIGDKLIIPTVSHAQVQ